MYLYAPVLMAVIMLLSHHCVVAGLKVVGDHSVEVRNPRLKLSNVVIMRTEGEKA